MRRALGPGPAAERPGRQVLWLALNEFQPSVVSGVRFHHCRVADVLVWAPGGVQPGPAAQDPRKVPAHAADQAVCDRGAHGAGLPALRPALRHPLVPLNLDSG